MNEAVERALARAVELRRNVLRRLPYEQRVELLEQLFHDFFVQQRSTLLKWSALTGQSAQVDTGYIAQHVASLVLQEPGQGFKGKGLDLADGSEVKSAAILSGVDRPRWNHDLGTLASDAERERKSELPKWQNYLNAPFVFYLLFDRVVDGVEQGQLVLRVRAWVVNSQQDTAWRNLLTTFVETRTPGKYNLQLHPPVGYDDSLVVNMISNLDMAEVKILEARMKGLNPGDTFSIEWLQRPPEDVEPVTGRCVTQTWRRGARPSRLAGVADVRPDLRVIGALIPGVDITDLVEASETEALALELDEE